MLVLKLLWPRLGGSSDCAPNGGAEAFVSKLDFDTRALLFYRLPSCSRPCTAMRESESAAAVAGYTSSRFYEGTCWKQPGSL